LFLKQNRDRCFSIPAAVRGKLVVDGNSVLRNHKHWIDGRYYKLHKATLEFFEPLVRAGVEPIVTLDGSGSDFDVMDTIKFRKELFGKVQKDKKYPRWKYHLSKQLDGVEVCIADGKSVHTTLGLAEYFNCPVLTSSSDCFVSGVTSGVILPEDLDLTTCTAPVFLRSELAKSLNFQNPDLVLAVAAVLGSNARDGNKILPGLYYGIIKGKIEELCVHLNIETVPASKILKIKFQSLILETSPALSC